MHLLDALKQQADQIAACLCNVALVVAIYLDATLFFLSERSPKLDTLSTYFLIIFPCSFGSEGSQVAEVVLYRFILLLANLNEDLHHGSAHLLVSTAAPRL